MLEEGEEKASYRRRKEGRKYKEGKQSRKGGRNDAIGGRKKEGNEGWKGRQEGRRKGRREGRGKGLEKENEKGHSA